MSTALAVAVCNQMGEDLVTKYGLANASEDCKHNVSTPSPSHPHSPDSIKTKFSADAGGHVS